MRAVAHRPERLVGEAVVETALLVVFERQLPYAIRLSRRGAFVRVDAVGDPDAGTCTDERLDGIHQAAGWFDVAGDPVTFERRAVREHEYRLAVDRRSEPVIQPVERPRPVFVRLAGFDEGRLRLSGSHALSRCEGDLPGHPVDRGAGPFSWGSAGPTQFCGSLGYSGDATALADGGTDVSCMRFRTWPVAALGLGGLLLLVVVSVLAASDRAQEIYTQLDQLNTHQREVETQAAAASL